LMYVHTSVPFRGIYMDLIVGTVHISFIKIVPFQKIDDNC